MVANLIVEHLAIKQKSNDFYLKCGIISLTNLNFGTEIGIISQTQRQFKRMTFYITGCLFYLKKIIIFLLGGNINGKIWR